VTFPTIDEIPVVKPVDVASLPEDVRAYRAERAKNWPSSAAVDAKRRRAAEKGAFIFTLVPIRPRRRGERRLLRTFSPGVSLRP
jgi:cleavage and polyadenylation specificity factor subunit 4